ncbi:TNFAIP3-interacting protein 3 [Antrostomus carolinensis]|uniref:TNFAIP3-interacting protein 3 n=1 Tax=Antrostomus carolinensis TaxID=279965 RepID=UPI0010A98884|nr:TNFAIP3-interacting protein 3 [Antrostomus carolinensis]
MKGKAVLCIKSPLCIVSLRNSGGKPKQVAMQLRWQQPGCAQLGGSWQLSLQSHCEQLKRKNKDAEDHLELCPHQYVEMERCESKELDVEIRNLIEKSNTYQSCKDPEPIAQESPNPQRTSCSLKTSTQTNAQGCLGYAWAGVSDMEASADPLESKHRLLTKKKTASSLEQHILSLERQRRELLEVNKQWDHQFRSMKQLYEKQLAEMKAKLDVSERRVRELEEERHRQHPEDERLRGLGREKPLQETKETKVLSEAFHEMKEENKLLKQKNASMIRKKEHYECEISRLNKALLDALKKQHSPVLGTLSQKSDMKILEDMRTQLEVLKQQVQIYEEDFKKERSDRERLNEEKEALQKINERLQSQLNQLNSQTKDLPVQSERPSYPPPLFLSPCINYGSCGLVLHYQDPRVHPASRRAHEQQDHSPDYQWYVPDQFPPDVQHKANERFSVHVFRNLSYPFRTSNYWISLT